MAIVPITYVSVLHIKVSGCLVTANTFSIKNKSQSSWIPRLFSTENSVDIAKFGTSINLEHNFTTRLVLYSQRRTLMSAFGSVSSIYECVEDNW